MNHQTSCELFKFASTCLFSSAKSLKRRYLHNLQAEIAFSKQPPKLARITCVHRLDRLVRIILEFGNRCEKISEWIRDLRPDFSAPCLEQIDDLNYTISENDILHSSELVRTLAKLAKNMDTFCSDCSVRLNRDHNAQTELEKLVTVLHVYCELILKQLALFVMEATVGCRQSTANSSTGILNMNDLLKLEASFPSPYRMEYEKIKAQIIAQSSATP
ncbi:unnamed protein product [Calicophoron daubneyi]|uniref:Uncharacterized protein n=1 Tax=Calicophoron daubneyi TaxID=300641 RepID=A0AAV2TMX4_CALDB